MNTLTPSASIIIPVFNRPGRLVAAVQSCLTTTMPIEVIVVDDGSSTAIAPLLESLYQEALREGYLHGMWQSHQGACAARNTGMEHARGEWIKFLDSDDILLPGTLETEVAEARAAGCDVLLSSWEERSYRADGSEDPAKYRSRAVPDLSRGIDDMLDGKSVCVSAALYRAAFVRALRWDPTWTKAQDWAWLLTVCLAGARFHSIDIPSCIYQHHPGDRITNYGDLMLRSTRGRQSILAMIERELGAQDALTESRRRQLAQYYYRDCQVLAAYDPAEWKRIWQHAQSLVPGFTPREPNRIIRTFRSLLGTHRGVCTYVMLKRIYFSIARCAAPVQAHNSAT